MNYSNKIENMKEDKILNNSYNTGEINHENLSKDIKVDPRIEHKYDEYSTENMIELRTKKFLNEKIYDIFMKSPYYKKYSGNKKIDKKDMNELYYYFKSRLLKLKSFTTMEMFIGIAEFFQINYKYFYNEIGVLDREEILKELNEKYNLQNRLESKKLF